MVESPFSSSEPARVTVTVATHTASDGYVWKYRRYASAGVPRAHLVFIHGIQSHGDWYDYSCKYLAQAGFLVSFLDRRGSGLNTQDRGDSPSFRRLLDDIGEFLQGLRAGSPAEAGSETSSTKPQAMPIVLAAISWGGKLAVALQRRWPGLVDGLILLCPGFFSKVHLSFRQRFAFVWAWLTAPRRLFPIPLDDPKLFTASPRWQQFIQADSLSLRQATARFLIHSARLDGYLRFVPHYVQSPVLLLLAGQDRIVDNERTRQFVNRFACKDREIIEYADAHHTLEFEPQPEGFLQDILLWLNHLLPEKAELDAHSDRFSSP